MSSNFVEKTIHQFNHVRHFGTGVFAAISHIRLLLKLKKRVKTVKEDDGFTENQIRYIRENFAKTEQYMLENISVLLRLLGVKFFRTQPLYLAVFKKYVSDAKNPLDEKALKFVFDDANSVKPYPTLKESTIFTVYMKTAICEEICRFFVFPKMKASTFSDDCIKRLFEGLDVVVSFDVNDCIFSNPTEKVLLKDRVYRLCTDYTKISYRKNLEIYAKKQKMTQEEYAKKLITDNDNFTGVLCDKPFGRQVYIVLHIFLTVLFTFFLCILSPIFLFSFIPVYRCVKVILDKFFLRFVVKSFTEPALELDKIPDGKGVLVTVTTLLTGNKSDEELFCRLEKMYYSCGEKNVYFALLSDLTDSDEKIHENDEKIINNAVNKILSLRKKHGDCFFLFIRERVYSKSEKCFIANERKRGAVNALSAFLCNKSDGFSQEGIKPSNEICNNIKYVFTLDADTNLAFDCVKKAVGIMLHPNNIPVIDEKNFKVIKGYGILQPKMSPTLAASEKSFFTSIMCGHGGVDNYSSASYDLAFSLFGKGVFCGKGMFDKECFYKVLCGKGAFKNNTVLSHDAAEGALLRCISTSHITLTDGFPREQMSYNKRRHRWIRGDIQNLHFFPSSRINEYGKRIKNNVDFVSKYLMFENIADGLLQIFSYIMIMLSLLQKDSKVEIMLVTVAVSAYILPFVRVLLSSIGKTFLYNLKRLFYSKGVYGGIWTELMRMFFAVSSIASNALLCSDAVIRGLFRLLISKTHTLEWTTAAQSDRESDDGILGYVKKNLFSAFSGTAIIVLSSNSFLKFVGLMWMALPFTAYFSGIVRKDEKVILPEKTKKLLQENLCDMWQYFEENVSEKTNFLPPDNISFFKEQKVSYMTSPTNIGLYLASACVALKGGFVSLSSLKEICTKTLETLEKMPKFKGLLYNWYDVRTLHVMHPHFVSSVDVGNYIACLYVLLGTLGEYENQDGDIREIIKRVKKLTDGTDFSVMYNSKRHLFYIGFNVEDDGQITYSKNFYDMLMSETRILSYLAVAHKKVDSSHFAYLSRPLIESGRYVGLASWSGTVFEYFMPALFLPVFQGSVSYEALRFAMWENVRNAESLDGNRGVFGISESCYNIKDDDGNYMYHAFGNERIALCVFEKQAVISPYSSYLMLEHGENCVLQNLSCFRDMGMYGKYGFYESCDFEHHGINESYGVVKSYMSHHVGMSICALGNFLYDGYVRDCFMRDGSNMSAGELLEERIPTEVYIKKRARKYYEQLAKQVSRPCEQHNDVTQDIKKTDAQSKEEIRSSHVDIAVNLSQDDVLYRTLEEDMTRVGPERIKVRKKQHVFEIECYCTKREGALIISVKTDYCGQISFETKPGSVSLVSTEAGGVIFRSGGDKIHYIMGFCKDGENISQGVCVACCDEKKGTVYFDFQDKQPTLREYTFVFGIAKSFDTVHYVTKRIVQNKERITKTSIEFFKELRVDSKDVTDKERVMLKKIGCYTDTARIVLPFGKYDISKVSKEGLLLMYTQSKLKHIMVSFLAKCLRDEMILQTTHVLTICCSFCVYCIRLEDSELEIFLHENTELYRLVILNLTQAWEDGFDNENQRQICIFCLELLYKVCKKSGDDAAGNIVWDKLVKERENTTTQGC